MGQVSKSRAGSDVVKVAVSDEPTAARRERLEGFGSGRRRYLCLAESLVRDVVEDGHDGVGAVEFVRQARLAVPPRSEAPHVVRQSWPAVVRELLSTNQLLGRWIINGFFRPEAIHRSQAGASVPQFISGDAVRLADDLAGRQFPAQQRRIPAQRRQCFTAVEEYQRPNRTGVTWLPGRTEQLSAAREVPAPQPVTVSEGSLAV